jgi:hypothetical protein
VLTTAALAFTAVLTGAAILPGAAFAFDVYPEGAPLGNKYQSIQINLY